MPTPKIALLSNRDGCSTLIGWGNSSGDGLKYYLLDNEHSIWFSTHRDIADR